MCVKNSLCVIPGDGIGKEVIPAAVEVLKKTIPGLQIIEAEAGWDCFLKQGVSVPEKTLESIRSCGAALFGAVSSPSKKVAGYRSAIITMRQELDLYSNIRPVHSQPRVSSRQDVDIILVRENTEGLYSGREHFTNGEAIAERVITEQASRRIARRAVELAGLLGRKRLTIIHKANILPLTDGLFRDSVRLEIEEIAHSHYLLIDEQLVDSAAFKLVNDPASFDMIVTTNLFGDILSDLASYWCGGLGLAPSLNWGEGIAVAEPVHGSAPDIAGKGIANPMAAILSAALLARYIWILPKIADQIENAVARTLEEGIGIKPGEKTDVILTAILDNLL